MQFREEDAFWLLVSIVQVRKHTHTHNGLLATM
jgi:hypothetical protein